MKRVLSLLVCVALLVGMLAGCTTEQEPVDTTPETEYVPRETPEGKYHEAAAEFAGGTGTEEDPYQISDASQLVLLNEKLLEEDQIGNYDETYTNAYYILTADISLNDTTDFANWAESAPEYNWAPIGSGTGFGFYGVFDGNGHTISGMYINVDANLDSYSSKNYGLFSEIRGTIKNLNVEQSYICVSGVAKNVGAIVGYTSGDAALVENCTSSAVIEVYEDGNAGGIVGNGGAVTGCQFSGTVTQLDEKWSHLGGIVGYGSNISDCTNLGVVSGSGYSGGIVGWGDNIANCDNQGAVTGNTAGGITGDMYVGGTGLEVKVTEVVLKDCVNQGTVHASDIAGGIAGHVGNDEVDIDMVVTGCENYGTVNCDQAAAGIIGKLSVERANILNVENCANYADISGMNKVGGIICELTGAILHQEGNVTISGCENQGNITSTEGMYSAGIVTHFMVMGKEIDLNLTLENCVNSGDITSQNYAGGILCFSTSMMGAADSEISADSAITLRGCTNSGDILSFSTNAYVGGIAGNLSAEGIRTLFEDCTNSGSVRLELFLTEEEIQASLDDGFVMSISQMAGGIIGRIGEGLLLTTDYDEGSAANVNAENAWITLRNCNNSGEVGVTDYSEYRTEDGQQVWKNYVGGIIGNTCAEDAYSVWVENCTYSGAGRGLGNEEYPDVGQKK